jgi:Protein of unknown function (DUF1553)/Protein of unknown function (DUF1549)/Planctomycete cytochrome C
MNVNQVSPFWLRFLPLFLIVQAASGAVVDFGRDIQPILAGHCYECHGPEKQKGKLRLDNRSSTLRQGDGAIILPGNAARSELYRRVTLPKGHEDVMPNRGEPLTGPQTDLIRDWINEGAVWPTNVSAPKHWSYVAPVRTSAPAIKNKNWPKNEIDRFVLARLEKEGLRPSPEAEPGRLLRRVYLDLIGLPPSPDEIARFVADKSPDAYERAVDRLLASPQYGERWARPWLDLARYADSLGFQRDNLWELWPYRDWVINALNKDMPFDQFTIEQLAGDLLPNATLDQKIATGFNRCTPINVEAGSDQEESRVNQVLDRVNTLGTVWLGSTIECCQCHNHKYDPFTQKDYYQLFAFFNNTPKESRYSNPNTTIALDFDGPYLKLPNPEADEQRAAIEKKIHALDAEATVADAKLLSAQADWEKSMGGKLSAIAQTHVLEIAKFESQGGTAHEVLGDKSVILHDDENDAVPERDTYTITVHTTLTGITGFKLETLADPTLHGGGPGRGDAQRPNFILSNFKVTTSTPESNKPQTIEIRKARADFEQKNFPVSKALGGDPKGGWGITPQFARDHWAIFETAAPVGSARGTTLTFTLAQNYGGSRLIGRLRLSAITGDSSSPDIPADIVAILQTPSEKRTDEQKRRVSGFYLSGLPEVKKYKTARARLNGELNKLQVKTTLAMQETRPRMSAIFLRGNFLDKGAEVQPDVPAVLLPPLSEGPRNRLTLARWLVSTNNPLTARVTVNRWWAEFFGRGLVATPEDFGIKGELPTHPELLDWLACELISPQTDVQSGAKPWSMKHIHRLIVTSATYRQSSRITPELREKDDQNKFYARGPRFRMDAEMIRDNALAAAGLLSLKMGGPPVHPYQPPGIWENKVGGVPLNYEISEGSDRYRRGIYTVIKRTSPYPTFITFDAPNRTTCVVRRPRSNTPLQALAMLNDPVYVEAAGALAKRVLKEKPSASTEEKIQHAFLLCTGRLPDRSEKEILLHLFQQQLQSGQSTTADAAKLLHDLRPEGIDAAEFAAWYSVASALLNLDETFSKG